MKHISISVWYLSSVLLWHWHLSACKILSCFLWPLKVLVVQSCWFFMTPWIIACQALGSITTSKANGGDGIPVELFQILKDDAVKVLHSIRQQIWKTQQWPQDWKRSACIPIPKKGNTRKLSNYCTIALISHASKVMLKSLQARLQQYVNHELPDVQAGFTKSRGTRDQTATIHWIIEKAREFQKNIYFCFSDYAKAFDCVDTTNCGKFFKRWEYQATLPAF